MPLAQHGMSDRRARGTGRVAASPTPVRRGHNHAGARRAIGGGLRHALALLLLCAALALAPPAAAQDDPLVQRNIPAEATAENAVVARDRALAAGQRIAYERMAAALGLPRGISDQQIEAMVASLVIESERITPRGYSARITVNFNPPGAGAGGFAAPLPPPTAPGARPGSPAIATLEAVARYRTLPEYVEITRRLGASPAVARVEVLTVSGEMARFRLGLRSPPAEAAAALGREGLALGQGDPRLGEGWRLGLGSR